MRRPPVVIGTEPHAVTLNYVIDPKFWGQSVARCTCNWGASNVSRLLIEGEVDEHLAAVTTTAN